ncbi:MAG: ATP-dependent RNA helicase HrpA [Verrucomicrobia bacterium]|nr:ATP-dependent RNA helicase HrpA [Verrucomicrobiota bacterium]
MTNRRPVARASNKPFPFRLEFPPELPISARAEEITAAIGAHQVVILAGETGSGKTTQIPKMCLAAGRGERGRIACTQPRRVAALSVSRRVAEELGVEWGREVGCKIRFNDQTTRDTQIKFLTDGMLLAEVQGDPQLRDYDTIIIDEAHERSLNIDFLLGHLRQLRFARPDLKIIITSATIDTAAFSAAFDGAPVVLVEGRTFPVEVIYAPLDELGRDYEENDENEEKDDREAVASAKAEALHYIDGAVEAVERVVRESTAGDVLVFLPSERDIREAGDLLDGRRLRECEVVPLFGRLTNAEQQRVFAPTQRRKIILATNIAETSLTIPGIRYVVDTGLVRLSRYAAQARTRRLPIEPISQSSADQRKGRAGRVAAGVCIRLYSEKDFLERPRFTQPEIQRANLADVILRLKAFGLGDIERFPFINPPATKAIRAGYAVLEELGALEARGRDGSPSRPEFQADSPSNPGRLGEASLPQPLTPIGRELARLPVDPTVGRMILQARSEKALREAIVIAAGLSIQDPRERPLEKQQQADAAHRRFAHPDSDFLTLLNIWDAWHDEFENLSQARLRRYCRDHFLSYTRMREWRDIHTQLIETLRDREEFKMTSALDRRSGLMPDTNHGSGKMSGVNPDLQECTFSTPAYRAIHRSILAGLLGNIATLDEEHGGYKATNDRRVALFPGSVLFRREEKRRKPEGPARREAQKKGTKSPRWIVASEIVETTRIYARTCARLDPLWALDLGAHLVRVAHSEPFWDVEKGRVMVRQRTRLYGLELESRAIGYGKIDPAHATEIFIREGLVNDTITFPLDCLAHNRALRGQLEDRLTRARDSGYLNLDEAAYRFYAVRLKAGRDGSPSRPEFEPPAENGTGTQGSSESGPYPGISSVGEFVDLVRERRTHEPRFLMMAESDLHAEKTESLDAVAFPPSLPLENRALPLSYSYKPGQDDDGVTLDVNIREAVALTPAALDWAVPGHLEQKVEHYVRALPKELRRVLVPLADTAKSLAAQVASRDRLTARRETLPEALAAQIAERFRVAVDPAVWADKPLPGHLRVRVRVRDERGGEICASRELAEIHAGLQAQTRAASVAVARQEPEAWRRARAQHETLPHATWSFGELPDRVLVAEQAGVPVFAYPGLHAEREGVAVRLFKSPEESAAATRAGVAKLLELQLSRDLVWLERDLRALRELGTLAATLAPIEDLQVHAYDSIRAWLCDAERCRVGAAVPSRPGFGLQGTASVGTQAGSESRPYLNAAAFAAAVDKAKSDLRGLVPRFVDLLREILSLRQELLVLPQPYPGLDRDLAALVPVDFLRAAPYAQLAHFPRYLAAMKLRADRARKNPAKDAERAAQLAPYEKAVAALEARRGASEKIGGHRPPLPAVESLRWLVEEFRVSLFAQELGTATPVSAKKLDALLAGFASASAPPAAVSPPSAKPIVTTPIPAGKSAPLKDLGALDKLFRR